LLDVDPKASQNEVKQAFRQVMLSHHPDKHGNHNDPIVRLINQAYSTLGDSEKRQEYDKQFFNGSVHRVDGSKKTATQRRVQCPTCKGFGYRICEDFIFRNSRSKRECLVCDGDGSIPGPKPKPGGNYSACSNCKTFGFYIASGMLSGGETRHSCSLCNGDGWLSGRKF